jgi:C-terminal peptidase prc
MAKNKYRFFLIGIIIAASLFFFIKTNVLSGLLFRSTDYSNYKILGTAISLIKSNYVEELNAVKTLEGGFKGMVDSLDVLSSYLNKDQLEKYRRMIGTIHTDVGIILYKTYGAFPQVIGVREGSSADRLGIKYGDFISSMDNRSTLILSMREANLFLKDTKENPISLKILRAEKTEDIVINRTVLYQDCFSFVPLKNTAGILKINHLYSCVDKLKKKVLPHLKAQKKPLVLDLRNCHEGNINEARKLINLFLKSDRIGYFSNRNGKSGILSCPDEPELSTIPLIIWSNRATIGSAEIVTAVLKDFNRAKIVGIQTTGLVPKQKIFPFKDGSGLLITTEIFNLVSGKELWGKGVEPDEKVDPQEKGSTAFINATNKILNNMS